MLPSDASTSIIYTYIFCFATVKKQERECSMQGFHEVASLVDNYFQTIEIPVQTQNHRQPENKH
jgi:hypothetical protein